MIECSRLASRATMPDTLIFSRRNDISLIGSIKFTLLMASVSNSPKAFDRCKVESPVLKRAAEGHWAACHLNDAVA